MKTITHLDSVPEGIDNICGKSIFKYIVLSIAQLVEEESTRLYFWKVRCQMCNNTAIISERMITFKKCSNCLFNPKGELGFKRLLGQYRSESIRNNREFTLTESEFRNMTSSRCKYCDSHPAQQIKRHSEWDTYYYNGIDRKDNSLGYTIDNCVPCCFICNRGKHTKSEKEFIEHLERIRSNANLFECASCSSRNITSNDKLQCTDCGSTCIRYATLLK